MVFIFMFDFLYLGTCFGLNFNVCGRKSFRVSVLLRFCDVEGSFRSGCLRFCVLV